MKQIITSVVIGVLLGGLIIAAFFLFFIILNPFRIVAVNTLKWIPLLAAFVASYVSGKLNKNIPFKALPILLLPFVLFKPFGFGYFPFWWVLMLLGILGLLISRADFLKSMRYAAGFIGMMTIATYLFSQPLILAQEGFGYTAEGDAHHAITLWDFNSDPSSIPNQVDLLNREGQLVNLADFRDKPYLITFWATWCKPCLNERADLETWKSRLGTSKTGWVDVSFDTKDETWQRFLEENPAIGYQLRSEDMQETSRTFEFSGIPMHIILQPNGSYQKAYSLSEAQKLLSP